jgi:hypothetical protein
LCSGEHGLVSLVVSAKAFVADLLARRWCSHHSLQAQAMGEAAAAVSELRLADHPANGVERSAHVAVAGAVDRELFEPAGHLPFGEQLPTGSGEVIDPAANAAEHRLALAEGS